MTTPNTPCPQSAKLRFCETLQEGIEDLLAGKTDAVGTGDVSARHHLTVREGMTAIDAHTGLPPEYITFAVRESDQLVRQLDTFYLQEQRVVLRFSLSRSTDIAEGFAEFRYLGKARLPRMRFPALLILLSIVARHSFVQWRRVTRRRPVSQWPAVLPFPSARRHSKTAR